MATASAPVSRAPETREQVFPFTLERAETDGDGLTFEGYAAVFNSPTEIRDVDGEYTEVVAPGAFKRSIDHRTPILMFDHGKHPLIGNMPLGKITEIREDPRGLYVKARLSDNWLVQPVRDAIRDQAVTGMSFRFEVKRDSWASPGRGKRVRTLREVSAPEVGPVVFPAYSDTTASVRSALGALEEVTNIHVTFGETRDMGMECDSPRDMVADAVEMLWGLSDDNAYIIDFCDDHAVFTVQGVGQEQYPGLWRVDWTLNGDGTVTIGTPAHPQLVTAENPEVETDISPGQNNTDNGNNSAEPSGEERAKYDAAARQTMAKNGQAMPDGSYPIADKQDLQNAIHAVGRGNAPHATIRAHIIKRAKALGATNMLPPDWMPSGGMNSQDPDTSEERATSTSEERVIEAKEPLTKDQVIRRIQLRERGIRLLEGSHRG